VPRWTKLRRADSDDTIRISRTIINRVMESKLAILSADASNDSQFAMSQSIADFRIRSMMCAPLIDSDGTAFGAMQIDTLDQRSRFQNGDLELLVTIAAQASIAIDNAQLHENALKQRALHRDMELAREVQQGLLPQGSPDVPGYSFFQFYQPQIQIGGDYFDYIQLPDGRIAMLVADVSGHGVAAALLMAKLSSEVRYYLVTEPTPAAAVTKLNSRLSALALERFITMIMVVLEPKRHELTIVNAGHMLPIIRRANGSLEEIGEEIAGPPLRVDESHTYEQVTVSLEAGEVVVMYTDGINEAHNAAGDEYGIDQIRKIVKSEAIPAAATIGQAIVDDVRRFLDKNPQDDDMCVVCVKRD
jgi:serine phosphatase RsbU (regulator of sigma subunit)